MDRSYLGGICCPPPDANRSIGTTPMWVGPRRWRCPKGLFGCEAQKYQGSIPLWRFLRDARDPLSSWGDSLHSLLSFGWTGEASSPLCVGYFLSFFFGVILDADFLSCPVEFRATHSSINKKHSSSTLLKKYKRQFWIGIFYKCHIYTEKFSI
jgi:hypothetical protein